VAREARRLARAYPNTKAYVEEDFEAYLDLLNAEQPHPTGDGVSWLNAIEHTLPNRQVARPFNVNAGYSQWRKVFLGLELVRRSGIAYSLIVRARPDTTVTTPIDLRQLEREVGSRPSAQRARGHFISVPERAKQLMVDQLALGTPEAMYAYAQQSFPYTVEYGEGQVARNLHLRCFARPDAVIAEEYSDPVRAKQLGEASDRRDWDGTRHDWEVLPRELRSGPFSPMLLTDLGTSTMGMRSCLAGGGNTTRCVPVYRTKFMYYFRASVKAWFRTGGSCFQYMNEGEKTARFLVAAGLAEPQPKLEAQVKIVPCVRLPALKRAWDLSAAWLATLDSATRAELAGYGRRKYLHRM
jgi:hypothetical protein